MNTSEVHELDLRSLVYVSRSTLSIEGDAAAVAEIVGVSTARNARLRVTGALVYTELHFAQLLEGPARAIDELMASIRADKRHRDVTVVADHNIASRRFADWAMAYAGPSPYLDRLLKPLISPRSTDEKRPRLVDRLIGSMEQLQAELKYRTAPPSPHEVGL